MTMAEFATGTVVDRRYRILTRLGAGGMADVFLAEDQQLGRQVALKLLHRRFAEDPGFVERFRREAQAAAGLQHPNVVNVYDRGEYDGTYYIAMEYLPGRSLKQVIRQEAPLEPVRAIDITLQILRAARFAHRRGVIHRDLKPHNVIVDDADQAKVTDFGIARAGASDMTETGSIMGTAQYLSPEQAQGHAVSPASDLYSIAVVLYEMLTGRVPFDADSAVTIALKHVSEAPVAPTLVNPSVPPELEWVVLWVLNKNPGDRPQDADQFIDALERTREMILSGQSGQRTASVAALAAVGGGAMAAGADLGGAPPAAARAAYGDDGDDGASMLAEPPGPPPEEPERRRRAWPWIVLLVALLLGGAAAAYVLTRPAEKVVPSVIREQLNPARTTLQNAGFIVTTINVTNNNRAGTVIGQDPQGGTRADQGSTVSLTVSMGPGSSTVPSVEGLPLEQAKSMINAAGFKIGRVVKFSSSQFPVGQVTGTDPNAGQSTQVGTRVTIFVSSGKPQLAVPDVTGQAEASAKAQLETDGFKVITSTQQSSTVTPGNVISQTPVGNSQATQGATIALVIATAPPTTTVPNVTGRTAGAATATLSGAGFKVTEQSTHVSKQNNDGKVMSQNPGAGTTVNKGSTVTITVGKFTPPTNTTSATPVKPKKHPTQTTTTSTQTTTTPTPTQTTTTSQTTT